MMRAAVLILMAASLSASLAACAIPTYEEPMPTSPQGWQRRQDDIQRQQEERARLCRITDKDDPRHEQLCRGVEGAAQ
jgi:outer membrane biogenesis lipoprotein LolB